MTGLAALLTKQAKVTVVPCIKTDYPFRLQDEKDYGKHIDRYRRITRSCLPIDPISNNVFCGRFYYKGWCTSDCNHPHHQSLDLASVTALTEYGERAKAWSASTPATEEELKFKPKWTQFHPAIAIKT